MATGKVKSVLERVQELELQVRQLTAVADQTNMVRQTVGEVIEVVQTMLGELGPDFEKKIEVRLQEKRDEMRRERDKRAADAVKQMLDNGILVQTDEATEDSLIVGREFNLEGEVIAERIQAVFGMFSPPVKEAILGKGVGTIYESETGKFEVLEVYKFVTPPAISEEVQPTAPVQAEEAKTEAPATEEPA